MTMISKSVLLTYFVLIYLGEAEDSVDETNSRCATVVVWYKCGDCGVNVVTMVLWCDCGATVMLWCKCDDCGAVERLWCCVRCGVRCCGRCCGAVVQWIFMKERESKELGTAGLQI